MEQTDKKQLTFPDWVRREAAKEHRWELGIGGEAQDRMIAYWKEYRPKMYRYLKRTGVLKLFAKIMEEKAMAQMYRDRLAMPPTDAREQAERDWYLMEEEEPDYNPEEDLQFMAR